MKTNIMLIGTSNIVIDSEVEKMAINIEENHFVIFPIEDGIEIRKNGRLIYSDQREVELKDFQKITSW
jgi:hypothetical protein